MALQDPYRNYRYRLEIGGITQGGFSDCSGYGATIDIIEYREGGEPAYVRKLGGQVKFSDLVLKWGIVNDTSMMTWFAAVASGQQVRKNGSVVLQDPQGNDVIRWNFFNALPKKYDPPTLTGKGNDVAIETMELAVERMERAK